MGLLDQRVQPLLPVKPEPFQRLTRGMLKQGAERPIQNPDMGFVDSMRAMDREAAHYAGVPLAYMTPGVGDVMAHQDAREAYSEAGKSWDEGRYLNAALHGLSGFGDQLTTVPALGDLAMLGKGLANVASTSLPLIAGTFAGRRARTADLDMLKVAEDADKAGLPMDRIRDATGWERGADDKWRFEIDDSVAKGNEITSWGASRDLAAGDRTTVPLGEALQHDAYGQAYPGTTGFGYNGNRFANRSMAELRPNRPGGGYGDNSMYVPAVDAYTHGFTRKGFKADKGTLLHEGQHLVQNREGFARGGNVDQFMPTLYAERQANQEILTRLNNEMTETVNRMDDLRLYRNTTDGWTKERQDELKALEEHYLKLMERRSELPAVAMQTPLEDLAYNKYRALAGEAEARNTASRMNLTADDRAMLPPRLTEDVPRDEQIIRYGDGPMESRNGEKLASKAERIAALRAEANKQRFGEVDDSYRGLHEAPMKDSGSPGFDLTNTYPEDIYGPKGAQYYGHYGQNDPMDVESVGIIRRLKGHPNRQVTVYRAVPKNTKGNELNPGDWVTINRKYAKEHGESTLGGDYKIVKKTVTARDIYTNGDSIHEWGYDPQPYVQGGLPMDEASRQAD